MPKHPATSRLSVRLYALMAAFGLGLAVVAGLMLRSDWARIRMDRVQELTVQSEILAKLIDVNRAMAESGRLTEEAAKAQAAAMIVAMTHGKGDYFFVLDDKGVFLAHPNPKLVGVDFSKQVDSNGFAFIPDVLPRALRDGVAEVDYMFPRAGQSTPYPKLGVYRSYPPWHWVIGTGLYLDDVKAEFRQKVLGFAGIALAVIGLLCGVATLIIRSIVRPIRALSGAMRSLAAGDLDGALPTGGSLAETRSMAGAVQVFQAAAIEKRQIEAEAAEQRRVAEADRARHEAEREAAAAVQRSVVEAVAGGLSQLSDGDLTIRLSTAFSAEYEALRRDFNAATT